MTWVVNTNTNTCHIYYYQKNPTRLTLLKEIKHLENKLKKEDFLASERPGQYHTGGSPSGAYLPHTDPKEVEIDNFSREIAKELNQGRKTHAYETLIIITPPHMNGLLFQHLDKHVKDLVINNIQKDLQHLKNHELLDFLQTNTQYRDES